MWRFVGRRTIETIPQAIGASLIIFLVLRVLPGDLALSMLADTPHTIEMREALREELGLLDPLPVQYGRWLWESVSGLRGVARSTGESLRSMIARQMPVTLLLMFYSGVISMAVSFPLGVIAAGTRRRTLDRAIQLGAAGGLALPSLWIALVLILFLLRAFSWSPPIIYFGLLEYPAEHLLLMVWPALILAWEHSSHLVPVVRSSVRDALAARFTDGARARGVSEVRVLWRHAATHAVRPGIAVAGLQIGGVLGGSLVLETIFGLPGMGRGIVLSAIARDFPAVQTQVLLVVLLYLLVALLADFLMVLVDPRMRRA